jgi:hypothetical protein
MFSISFETLKFLPEYAIDRIEEKIIAATNFILAFQIAIIFLSDNLIII